MTFSGAERGEACSEKLRLASEYRVYAAQYSEAVKNLQKRMGVLSKAGYDDLLIASEASRDRAEKARLALNLHVHEHGC